MHRRSTALAVALAVLAGGLLTACSSTVSMQPAPHANDPLCAEVSVRLPQYVAGEERQWTDAQATGAWGSPTKVLLTCGVEPPGPTTLRCEEVAGVDWIIDESQAPRFRVTTYGREPAVELFFDTELAEDSTGVSSRDVLDAISPLLTGLTRTAACVAREDVTPAG